MDFNTRIKDRIHGMLAGVAIGDALGMPVETMSRKDIALLNGGTGVTGYMQPVQTRISDTKVLKLGDTTDDWQLTRAVAVSLTLRKAFDISHQAEVHLKELDNSTFGWGKGTVRSLAEIKAGTRKAGEEPLWSQPGKGCGNGVLMKVSPLAAVGVMTDSDMTGRVLSLGKLTHPDVRARIAAVVIERYLERALLDIPNYRDSFLEHLQLVRFVEELLLVDSPLCHFLSNYLRQVDYSGGIDSLIKTSGVGFTAWETAGFSIGVYSRHQEDFSTAVLEAVNAGGDTDTNASIVGALVGARIGYSRIPDCWKSIPVMQEVEQVSKDLWAAFA